MRNHKSPKRPRRRQGLVLRWVSLDIIIILFAFAIAFSARAFFTPLVYLEFFGYIIFCTLVIVASMYLSGVYDRIWAQTSGHGVALLVRAVGIAFVITLVINLVPFDEQRPLPLSILALGNLLSLVGLVAVRYRSRLLGAFSWRWRAVIRREFPASVRSTRMLIVGAGEAGQTLAWRLKHRFRDSQYLIIGFVDDDPDKQGMFVEGCPILGVRQDIPRLTEEYGIDIIVMSIHNITGQDFRDILNYCEGTKAMIKVVPDMLELINARHSKTMLRDVQPEDLIGRSIITQHEAVSLEPVQNRVVLVTGAAGSIGSELSRQMATHNPVQLILLDNNESSLHDLIIDLQSKHPDLDIIPVLGDVSVDDVVRPVFEQFHPQVVFHAAAYKHVPMLERYPQQAVRVNVGGTRLLAECACEYHVERFVLISTDKAVNPSSVMGATKRLCELIVHVLGQSSDNDTLFTAVRFGNVLGSRGSVVPTFNRQIDNGGPVTITHKDMTRYFMSISEAVNLVIHAACITQGDDIFLLRMGEVVRIQDIAERMIRLRGLRPNEDIPIQYIGMRPGEKLHEELHDDTEDPTPTIHPHILKLANWKFDGDGEQFKHHIDLLLLNGLNPHDNALSQLRHIAGGGVAVNSINTANTADAIQQH